MALALEPESHAALRLPLLSRRPLLRCRSRCVSPPPAVLTRSLQAAREASVVGHQRVEVAEARKAHPGLAVALNRACRW